MTSLADELSQLRESYLLLQEEYWRQKEKLLELDIEVKQLQQTTSDAVHKAEKVRGGCKVLEAVLNSPMHN
jgi:predicted  nucleic acid-binding Zn-ribbon protein